MEMAGNRIIAVWRRSLSLSWPLSVEQLFSTLMRTTDLLVTGLFSPAAVAAVGLADLYAQIAMRFGHGIGTGVLALASQDTGRGAIETRDEAITQGLILGFVAGVPLVAFGYLFGRAAIALLGANPEVIRLGGSYLMIILIASPAYIVGLVGSRALQATGDTRTPMYVNITANLMNITGSVVLGLGIGGAPRLGIIGVGLATAVANGFTSIAIVGWLVAGGAISSFTVPRNPVVTRQLISVSIPEAATGLITTAVYFPFNALLVGLGTEVVAAYHIGNRLYHQTAGPLYRAYGTTASILVGQALGKGDRQGARFNAWALAGLALITLGIAGIMLTILARPLVLLFTSDPLTVDHATGFARTYGVVMLFVALFFVFSGALRGAGDTMTPLVARLTGLVGFFLVGSYFASTVLGYGVTGIYLGMGIAYVWMAIFLTVRFLGDHWVERAVALMADREGREL
jgi:putative MATE family efflux protein